LKVNQNLVSFESISFVVRYCYCNIIGQFMDFLGLQVSFLSLHLNSKSTFALFWYFRLTLVLSCPMHFKNYPHDTQECNLEIESSKYFNTLSQGPVKHALFFFLFHLKLHYFFMKLSRGIFNTCKSLKNIIN